MAPKRTIVYGAGNYYNRYKHLLLEDLIVTAFADGNREIATSNSGKLKDGVPILTTEELREMER